MYKLISDLVLLVEEYEQSVNPEHDDVALFGQWLSERKQLQKQPASAEPDWLGKTTGRSAESVINTSLVHLYRFARLHAKAAIVDSDFATPDELIYLINLRALGDMTKTALIRLNVHEKSAGIQIINRLIMNEMVEQVQGDQDKRSKIISITDKGIQALENSMENFREASVKVAGDINHEEKMALIRILNKLEGYHMEHSKSLLQ